MASSTPLYDQFARNRTSLRPVGAAQNPVSGHAAKQSISFVTSAPIEASTPPNQHTPLPQRRQFRISYKEQSTPQQSSPNADTTFKTPPVTDLKHSRSQSHALFPIKRKEVPQSITDSPKRAQSVSDTQALRSRSNAKESSQSQAKLAEAATGAPSYSKKFVVVGDGGSGKTCLLMRYKERTFPDTYIPTVFENYITQKYHNGSKKVCEVALWDTAGQEEYDRLRPLSYPETDVLLVCFAIDCPQSLDSVKEKWYPEVLHFCPTTPLILVGCKSDLRDNDKVQDQLEGQGLHMLTVQQCVNTANYIGAEAYIECSSKEMLNVDEIFELSMDISIGQEMGVDWRARSTVARKLANKQLGSASQLGQSATAGLIKANGHQGFIFQDAGVNGNGRDGTARGSKYGRKKRRTCKIL